MRGDLVSRPVGDVLREAERLAKAGVKELLVISQDTSAYGVDIKYASSTWREREVKAKFYDMAEALSELGIWVRMHYVYPYPHVDAVIELMQAGKILPYLDIPFQHASPNVLKAMKRPAAQEKTLERITRWRTQCPDLTLRSTFVVGFPGETEEDFQFLLDWLKEAQLDRVGCFKYEAVTGAAANALPNQIPEEVKEERWHRFMQTQQGISAARLHRKVGTVQEVLIDEVKKIGAIGRTQGDAPEIDGVVHLAKAGKLKVGDLVKVEITRAEEYDLHGSLVE
jgi:ribosomal protein S12 methylthiotransferase